jgi:hypothetical protein
MGAEPLSAQLYGAARKQQVRSFFFPKVLEDSIERHELWLLMGNARAGQTKNGGLKHFRPPFT